MKPLVSILIPAHNREKWIQQSIQSALNQTWENIEIIIVDDGSTDGTLQVARRFESTAVKVVAQENCGASAARNRAYSFSQGDYIQWLDSDDVLAPDKISRQLDRGGSMRGQDSLLSSAWGTFVYKIDNARFHSTSLWEDLLPVDWMIRSFESGEWMQTACWLVPRALAEAAGNWDENLTYNDDGEYFSRVVTKCKHVTFVPGARVYYRSCVPGSLSSSLKMSENILKSCYLSTHLTVDCLLALENTERTRKAAVARLHRLNSRLYPYLYKREVEIMMKHNDRKILSLGGRSKRPKETWKFLATRKMLGFKNATKIRDFVNWTRSCMLRVRDIVLFL